jgi:hypothetical protein
MIITKHGDIISSIEMLKINKNLLDLKLLGINLTMILENILLKDNENK